MSSHPQLPSGAELEYLCVDEFLRDFLSAQTLSTAFALGLVDLLLDRESVGIHELQGDPRGLKLLLDLLRAAGVVQVTAGSLGLTQRFIHALKFRDLLEAKLEFANMAAGDFLQHFGALVQQPRQFMAEAAMFRLFDYGRAWGASEEDIAYTRRWMRLTTSLTRYEAGVVLAHYSFAQHRRLLDVGGNSGEFASQICAAWSQVEATVFDLPAVCAVGRAHVATKSGGDRVRFVAGDARRDELPTGHDVITFKSMLHDWPEADAVRFLERAVELLPENGAIVIFERDVVEIGDDPLPYGALPLVAFAGYYRGPQLYSETLRRLGFDEVNVQRVQLELPFFLLSARRKASELSEVRWTV